MKTFSLKRRKHVKNKFKGAGKTKEEELTEEPLLTLDDITLDEQIEQEPITLEQQNIDNFNKIVNLLKKINKTNNSVKKDLYSTVIVSILNDDHFDLSKINEKDQAYLLYQIMKTYYDDIIDAYVNVENPYITEKILMSIIGKIHPYNEDLFSIDDFINTIDKMKERKENFPNIKNFLEDRLNIVETFTSEDTPKIIDLIKEKILLKNLGGHGNELKSIYYKNTIDYILENKQLDLSKINETDDKYLLLMYVIESDDNKILDAYLKLRNTGLTDEMLERVKKDLMYDYNFNRFMRIKPKLQNKLMKIKADKEAFMQSMSLNRWNPTGQEMPKELQFNTLSYLQPKAKPTPSGKTHDDVIGNAIQYAVDNPKVETSSSSSNTLGGRRKTRRFKKTNRRRTMRKK